MRNRILFTAAAILVCFFVFSARESTSAQNSGPAPHPASAAGPAAAPSKSECLSCHGPFDKLVEVSDKYTAPSGEKISPHRYVPHDSKKEEDIPECANCHVAHPLDPLPVPGSVDLSKVNVQWCYTACHHEKNFTSCKSCHP
jgi:hypothetical protein